MVFNKITFKLDYIILSILKDDFSMLSVTIIIVSWTLKYNFTYYNKYGK